MYLNSKTEFTLALAFLGCASTPKFALEAEDESVVIKAETPFLVFVKEAKAVDFQHKYGILISQRIYDFTNQYSIEEDGTQI